MEQFGSAYHHIPFPPMITDPYGFLPVPASQTSNPLPRASLLAQRSQFSLTPTPPASPTMHPGWAPAPTPPMASRQARRTAQLRTYLDPTHQDYQNVEQHANIRKAIRMYQFGELDGWWTKAVIMDGRVVSEREARSSKRWCWVESGVIPQ